MSDYYERIASMYESRLKAINMLASRPLDVERNIQKIAALSSRAYLDEIKGRALDLESNDSGPGGTS